MIFHKYLFNIHGTGDSESNSYNILTNFFIILSTTVFSVVYQSIVNSILYSCFIYKIQSKRIKILKCESQMVQIKNRLGKKLDNLQKNIILICVKWA